jgi:hypothetical protein
MGLFTSGKRGAPPADPPVRRGQVMRLLAATMAESDADPESPDASRRLSDLVRRSTRAEIRAANDAARRNGY